MKLVCLAKILSIGIPACTAVRAYDQVCEALNFDNLTTTADEIVQHANLRHVVRLAFAELGWPMQTDPDVLVTAARKVSRRPGIRPFAGHSTASSSP